MPIECQITIQCQDTKRLKQSSNIICHVSNLRHRYRPDEKLEYPHTDIKPGVARLLPNQKP